MTNGTYVVICCDSDGAYIPLMFILPDAGIGNKGEYVYWQECAIEGVVYDAEIHLFENESGEVDNYYSYVGLYHYDTDDFNFSLTIDKVIKVK